MSLVYQHVSLFKVFCSLYSCDLGFEVSHLAFEISHLRYHHRLCGFAFDFPVGILNVLHARLYWLSTFQRHLLSLRDSSVQVWS